MTIRTYNNRAENIRVDKSPYLTGGTEFSNEVKMEGRQPLETPTFMFNSATEPTWNYVYIQDFSRYYYVTNIVWVANNMWEISCSEDVLMSNKAKILALTGVAARLEDADRSYIIDDKLTAEVERYDDFDVIEVSPVNNDIKFDLHPQPTGSEDVKWNILVSAFQGENPISGDETKIAFKPTQATITPTFSEDVYAYTGRFYSTTVNIQGTAELKLVGFPQFDVTVNGDFVTSQSRNLSTDVTLIAGQTNTISIKVYYLSTLYQAKTYTFRLSSAIPNQEE